MTYRALDIANYVVDYALSNGKNITHLQLQKILYYLEAFYLVNEEKSLIREDIEKWKLGPVVPEVYHRYKFFGSENITYVPKEIEIKNEGILSIKFKNFEPNVIKEETKKDINPKIDSLLKYSGIHLVNETHKHEIWRKDLPKIKEGERGLKYSKDEIKNYFEKNLDKLEILNE